MTGPKHAAADAALSRGSGLFDTFRAILPKFALSVTR